MKCFINKNDLKELSKMQAKITRAKNSGYYVGSLQATLPVLILLGDELPNFDGAGSYKEFTLEPKRLAGEKG